MKLWIAVLGFFILFQIASQIMKFLIDSFGISDLFGRENYEYYAKITGRILKVEEEWIYAFRYPPDTQSLTLRELLFINDISPHFNSNCMRSYFD